MSASEKATALGERSAGFLWRRVAIALGVLVVALVVVAFVWQWLGDTSSPDRLLALLYDLNASDPTWRLEDLDQAREKVPEASNSANVVHSAAGRLPGRWPLPSFSERFARLRDMPAVRLDNERAALLREEMAARSAALTEARRLAVMPRGRHPAAVVRALILHAQVIWKVAALLVFDALDRAERGNVGAALESCRARLNVGRSLGDESLTDAQGIRISCVTTTCDLVERALAQGEATEADLAALQGLLHQEEQHPTLLVCARGFRAVVDDLFTRMEDGTVKVESLFGKSLLASSDLDLKTRLFGFSQADIRRERARALELTTRLVNIARLPEHLQRAEERKLNAMVRALPPSAILTMQVASWPTRTGENCRLKTAQVRALMALVAVERYRLKNGKWPASLEELKPDFLAAVPLGPFDGKPLRYSRRPEGVTVYSVGPNGVDDGGKVGGDNPERRGAALGYRLWDVKARRQAPAGGK
jgi:hypothetical protein